MEKCSGQHHFYHAETVAVPSTGKVHLLFLCTDCGNAQCKEFDLAPPNSEIRLLKEEKKDK